MNIVMGALGMTLGIIRDVARARRKEDFKWGAWLGERPWQFLTRVVTTVGVLSEQAATFTEEQLAGSMLEGQAVYMAAIVAFLMGLYGDRAGKNILEKIEENSDKIPLLRKLWLIGKKLT